MRKQFFSITTATALGLGSVFAVGCESRDTQVPKDPSLAWNDAPLWYSQQGLLVPVGSAPGNSGSNGKAAKKKKTTPAVDSGPKLAADRAGPVVTPSKGNVKAAAESDDDFANPGVPTVPSSPASRGKADGAKVSPRQ